MTEEDALAQIVRFIKDSGYCNINCFTQYDPPRVEIDTVFGLQINIDYNQYQQIREAAGLPDDVCNS